MSISELSIENLIQLIAIYTILILLVSMVATFIYKELKD